MKISPEPASAVSARPWAGIVTVVSPASGERKQLALLLVLLALGVLLTRWPMLPPHLYSFDSVNFALALTDFNPTLNQPQPPGYPLFVLEARAWYPLLGTPERTFALIKILISALSVLLLYSLGRVMISARLGVYAAALLLANPIFWYSGITSPLRPHLALFSILVAYFCWRALSGDRRAFFASCVALAVGSGFRPELGLILLPLWFWSGWQCGGLRLLAQGAVLGAGLTSIWAGYLAMASGGFLTMLRAFRQYSAAQTFQTAAFSGLFSPGWRHMVGRVAVWISLGAMPWLWALPFGWAQRREWLAWHRGLVFLGVWMVPSVLLHMLFHSADPDHVLPSIPAVCLVGAFCLWSAEESLQSRFGKGRSMQRWLPWAWLGVIILLLVFLPAQGTPGSAAAMWAGVILALLFLVPGQLRQLRGSFLSLVLLANIVIFVRPFPFPTGPAGGVFRGLNSVKDAFLGGIYETSYNRINWVSNRTELALRGMQQLERTPHGETVLIWGRDGEPVWRKLAYYFPSQKVYVLDEAGDPGVLATQARIMLGKQTLARYQGAAPLRLPVPRAGRLVWFVGGGQVPELAKLVPLKATWGLAYSDLSPDSGSLSWGPFELVQE